MDFPCGQRWEASEMELIENTEREKAIKRNMVNSPNDGVQGEDVQLDETIPWHKGQLYGVV
jgi:hypothetical protein